MFLVHKTVPIILHLIRNITYLLLIFSALKTVLSSIVMILSSTNALSLILIIQINRSITTESINMLQLCHS